MIAPEYSSYTLSQLFKARYWTHTQGALLEEEIKMRCANIRARLDGERSAAGASSRCFRPYGLILGVAFLTASAGPFVVVRSLDIIGAIDAHNGDLESLAGVWALLTLPLMVAVFLFGAMRDAEQVTKWLNLADRQTAPLPPDHRSAAAQADTHAADGRQGTLASYWR